MAKAKKPKESKSKTNGNGIQPSSAVDMDGITDAITTGVSDAFIASPAILEAIRKGAEDGINRFFEQTFKQRGR